MANLATITTNILADSGIDDINVVVSTGSYADPAWITSLAWTKITGAPANIVTGTGTTNYLPKFTGTSTIGNSQIFDNGTNVGVGSITPLYKLDVAGEVRANNLFRTIDGSGNIGLFGSSVFASNVIGIGSSNNIPLVFGINASEQMRLTSTGLGIGTTSPNRKLVVQGTFTSNEQLLYLKQGDDNGFSFNLDAAVTGNLMIRGVNSGTETASLLTIRRDNGNVGINTTTDAGFKLDVNGTGRFSGVLTTNSGTNSTNGIQIISSLSSSLFTGGIEFLRTTVAGGSKVQPLREASTGGVGFDFLVTANNTAEINATYTSALRILNTGAATFSNLAGSGTRMVVADANGLLSTQAIGSGSITGSGTTNFLPKFTGTSTIGNSIVQEGGAGILISGTDNFTSQNGGWFFNGSGNYASGIFASSSSNILTLRSPQNISFQIGFSTPSMTLTSGGNLLVGTTTDAGFKLDVNGTGRFSGAGNALRLNSSSNDVWQTFTPETGHIWRWQARTTSQFSIYNENLGVFPFTIESTGAATFSSSVTTGGGIQTNISKSGSGIENVNFLQLRLFGTNAIGDSLDIRYLNSAGNNIANISAILGGDNVAYGSLAFSTRNYFTDSMVEVMRINNRGNVGIATDSPTQGRLVVVADSSAITLALRARTGDDFSQVNFLNNAGNNLNGIIGVQKVGTNGGSMYFYTKPDGGSVSEAMRITPSGRVLIGTPPPAESTFQLDVNGTGRFSGGSSVPLTLVSSAFTGIEYTRGSTLFGFIGTENTASGGMRYNSIAGNFEHKFYNNGTLALTLTSTGAATFSSSVTASGGASGVGFIMTNTTNSRQVTIGYTSGAAYNYIQAYDGTNFQPLMVNGNLWVAGNANVGIGTTSPANKLDVVGDGIRTSADQSTSAFLVLAGSSSEGRITVSSYGGFQPMTFYTGGSERMRITSGGLVLIGTSTLGAATGLTDLLTIGKSGSSSTGVNFTDGTSTRWGFIYANNAKMVYGSFTDVAFESGASATERMRITSGGNTELYGNLSLRAAATGSTATHVPVFIADPASTTRSLLTRTLQDFKFDVGSFIAKGVRSNAGDYTRTLDSVNDYSLWQDNFDWDASYNRSKVIIEAQTTGNINSSNTADKQLTIGWGISSDTNFNGDDYCTVNVPLGTGAVDYNVIINGTITITSNSELKMVIRVQIASGNVIEQNVMRMANVTAAGAMLNAAKNIAFTGKMNVTGTHTWSQRQTYLRLN
jgi:hypothetical protein